MAGAQKLHFKFYPLFKHLFLETNPVPIKTALAWAGRITAEMRLPLCEMSEANQQTLLGTLRSLNLVK